MSKRDIVAEVAWGLCGAAAFGLLTLGMAWYVYQENFQRKQERC